MLKIAVLSSGLGHVQRGAEASSEKIAHGLKSRGYDVILYKGGGESNGIEHLVPCFRRGGKINYWISKLMPQWCWHIWLKSSVNIEGASFAFMLLPRILSNQPDVLYSREPAVAFYIQLFTKLRLVRGKLVVGNGTNIELHALEKFDFVHELSPHKLEDSMQKMTSHRPHWTYLPNMVDVKKFYPRDREAVRRQFNIPQDAYVILSVAAIQKRHKRIDYLIKEMTTLIQNNPKVPYFLLVVGAFTEDTVELEQIAVRLLGDKVKMLYDVPRSAMPEIYSVADVFVHCALHEIFGNVFLEAMSSGVPIIAHDDPGNKWIIGEGGTVINMGANGELACAISSQMHKRNRNASISLLGRNRAVEEFSINKVIERYGKYFEQIVK